MRRWLPPAPFELPQAMIDAVGSRHLAELLFRRGFRTPDAALAFLAGGIDVDAPGLPDLEVGVEHLIDAVRRGQRICVYGDYDTDGITSTTLLVDLLRMLGANYTYYIPNRFRDGYGMNSRAVEALSSEGVDLILTCDCGIKNIHEIAVARSLGMRVVVTDHHELGPALPVAEAVINPKRLPDDHPCRMLPGVGTAYLVARQVLRALGRPADEAERWLDLVAVGIIADVVPLHGANRELARLGLNQIMTDPSVGLKALLSVAGLGGTLTEEEIAFQVVPRLNSAGRLSDATLGVRLLLSQGEAEALDLAQQLDQLNQERKRITATVIEAAAAEVEEGASAIILYRPEWHEGVLGIAAGKLAEQHGIPALLMARKHGTNQLVGSARSPLGFSLHEALEVCTEHLLRHGGHAAAAGFSLLEERFPSFRTAMLEEVRRRTVGSSEPEARYADLALPLAAVDRSLYDHLRRAAPFGEGNEEPVIYSPAVQLMSARPVGPGEKHLRMVMRDGEQSLVAVWWGGGSTGVEPGPVDLYYRVGLSRYKGNETLQAVVEHLTPAMQPMRPVSAARPLRPKLVDQRGAGLSELRDHYPSALFLAEGIQVSESVDRYGLLTAKELVLLTTLPSPRLLDELSARSGARELILAWPKVEADEPDSFLPRLMRALGEAMGDGRYVALPSLASMTGELESVVRLGLQVLHESGLLEVEEEPGERFLLQRLPGKGVREAESLRRMKQILAESRAYRRFLRQADVGAVARSMW